MALHLRAAGRVDSRLAAGGRSRGPATLLLVLGSVALLSGGALLLTSLAPYFSNPSGSAVLSLPLPAPSGPTADTSVVVAPETPGALPAPAPVEVAALPDQAPVDGVWFEMRIPAVGYRAVVRQGVALSVLDRGPGHYPSTPWPGRGGNVGVAGHNTFWLSFNHLKAGDRVEIRTQHGLYVYEITGSKVVDPNDRTVLAPTEENRLTLTTCYPLWAGAFATQRLVFIARQIGGVS